jgi:hypothetical protein
MRKVFLISSIIIGIAVLVAAFLALNKYAQVETQKKAELELQQAKLQIGQLESEKKQLLSRISDNEKEMLLFKDKLGHIQKQLDSTIEQLTGLKTPLDPKVNNSGESMNDTVLKAQKLGKSLAKMMKTWPPDNAKGPTPEQAKATGELMTMMGELNLMDIMMMDKGISVLSVFTKPEINRILPNMVAGLLEELGQPMSKMQMEQFEGVITKMSKLTGKVIFTVENQTDTEKTIAYLEHIEDFKPLSQELKDIFTREQKESKPDAFKSAMSDELPFLEMSEVEIPSDISKVDKSVAANQIFRQWETPSPERNANIKMIIEQYLSEYTDLRKTLESCYDKDIMDYYYERNAPAGGSRIQYNQERNKLFKTNSRYGNAKAALDLDFLRLQGKFEKELARLAGSDKTNNPAFQYRTTTIHHYPNVE